MTNFKYQVSEDRTKWQVMYAKSAPEAAENYCRLLRPDFKGKWRKSFYVRGAAYVNGRRLSCTISIKLVPTAEPTFGCEEELENKNDIKVSKL